MIVDPVEALMAASPKKTMEPIPTVVPNPIHYQVAGDTGKRTLWVVFAIMLISSLAMYAMAFRVPAQKRLFHILTAFITTFATISYYAMAVGDGTSWQTTTVTEKHHHGIPNLHHELRREIYWARYVDWTITTPLLLADLCLLAGVSGANMLVAIVADIIMCLTGLFAALSQESRPRWGYYAMGCLAYLVIVYQLAIGGRATVRNKDSKTATFYSSIAGFTLVLWTIYPIIWGVADGSHRIGVNAEIIAYAILDVLAKPVFGFWLLSTHDAMASSSLSLDGFWAHGFAGEGGIRVGDDDDGA
jgi:bacteriorhodopsin